MLVKLRSHLSRPPVQARDISLSIGILARVLLILWLGLSVPAQGSDLEFRLNITYGGTWRDAEKSKGEKDDDWQCWAAAASNILAWTGWAGNPDLRTEDDIFRYFRQHWIDHPEGSPREAWRWWFTGEDPRSGAAKVARKGGGFWPNILFPTTEWGGDDRSLFRGIGQKQLRRHPYLLRRVLEEGYGVVVQIVRPMADGSRDSHMITLWGFRHDSQNGFKGILVTDSDDGKDVLDATQAKDNLAYYPVQLRNGEWWFRYRDQDWKILAAYALQAKSRYRP